MQSDFSGSFQKRKGDQIGMDNFTLTFNMVPLVDVSVWFSRNSSFSHKTKAH